MASLKNVDKGVSFRNLKTIFSDATDISKPGELLTIDDFCNAIKKHQDELGIKSESIEILKQNLNKINAN